MSENQAVALKETFDRLKRNQWKTKLGTSTVRKQKLAKLKAVISAHEPEILAALKSDLRKTDAEAATEIAGTIGDIDHAIAHLDEWMKPVEVESSPHMQGTRATIIYEPRGVCLLFAPWNFPFLLAFQPLIPMLAAGNCVIVKPNELTPATSKVIATIVRDACDPDEVAAFEGGIDLANQLLELPFDHIFFTGSPKVGRVVMSAAAKHLASVTLELGGKCPAIVDGTADVSYAAGTIAAGRFYNAGQVCLCPDMVWVPEAIRDEFVAHLAQIIETTFYKEDKLDKNSFGKIVDSRNFDRVKGYVTDATARGAKIVTGGTFEAEDLTIHPTILVDPPLDAVIMREEVFAPVISVLSFKDPSEITDFLAQRGKPLAMYVFSNDQSFIDRMVMMTSSGGVTVNGWAAHWFEHNLPFGGVNESGIGRYHGVHGFRELSHERAVLTVPAG